LGLLNLSLPLTLAQLKHRCRELAMRWHPDHNLSSPQAQGQTKALNPAVELLGGLDVGVLSEKSAASFITDEDSAEFEYGGAKFAERFGFGSELLACDWVYAADFAARATAAYLGGRVVMVDQHGEGLRVYEVGVVPRRIIDTGEFLYILAPPALYVLRDDSLINLVDVPDER